MPYTLQYSNPAKSALIVADGTINNSTSLHLVGRNAAGYGQSIAENFLHSLENFASDTSPSNPIEGQLWYNTSYPTNKVLNVYNGTNWVPANGVYQQSDEPVTKKAGDIWVKTSTSKVYIWNSSAWILVGPEVTLGGKNGTYTTTLRDSLGDLSIDHSVVITYLNDEIISIVSREEFIPNPVIAGFTKIYPGLNVSTSSFNGTPAKVIGLASTALSLKLSGIVDPISADNFLRSDIPGTISGFLNINNNGGIRIGAIAQTVVLEKQANNNAVLSNRVSGSTIGISIVKDNAVNQIITVNGNTLRVGINNLSPTVALDVTGSGKFSGKLTVSSTDIDSVIVAGGATFTKTITTDGGITARQESAFNKKMVVGYVGSTGTAIEPGEPNAWDIGTAAKPFKTIYATSINNGSVTSSFVVTGMITAFGSNSNIPAGWLLCDGASHLRSSYANLFAVIGDAYGATSGNHFSAPTLASPGNPNIVYIIKY